MGWRRGAWLLLPLAAWLLLRSFVLAPAQAQLLLAQRELSRAERDERKGARALERAKWDLEALRRRREALVADSRRLVLAERLAARRIRELEESVTEGSVSVG